jgi:hypothetical protein
MRHILVGDVQIPIFDYYDIMSGGTLDKYDIVFSKFAVQGEIDVESLITALRKFKVKYNEATILMKGRCLEHLSYSGTHLDFCVLYCVAVRNK